MLPRVLETEAMDTAAEAADYDAMNHAEVNRRFVEELLAFAKWDCTPRARRVRVLDVGTGTAQIPIELCRQAAGVHVTGVDLAAHMLQLGQRSPDRLLEPRGGFAGGCCQRDAQGCVLARRVGLHHA